MSQARSPQPVHALAIPEASDEDFLVGVGEHLSKLVFPPSARHIGARLKAIAQAIKDEKLLAPPPRATEQRGS